MVSKWIRSNPGRCPGLLHFQTLGLKIWICLTTCLFGLLLGGCTGTLSHLQDEQRHREYAFQEMRTEIGDLKHAMQAQRTELQILQDRLSDQETIAKNSMRNKPQTEQALQALAQIAACERKMATLEKTLDKLSSDLRGLNKHAEQTSLSLSSFKEKILDCQKELSLHSQKLEGVSQLKTTLGQISQAISERSSAKAQPSGPSNKASYKVKPGDTLEKIARQQGVPLTVLKRLNNISQDKIIVGQELKITDDGE